VDESKLRELPSVHEAFESLSPALSRFPRSLVVAEIRRAIESLRTEIRRGAAHGPSLETRVGSALAALERPSLRRVINATGVVLHTNLGRAPLPSASLPAGYSNLEYDLAAGRRGKRDVHISGLLERLFGASGIAVNNNAAAVFLALNEFAFGGEVIVSRGELVEIGDGFRIPDIMARSGAVLVETGTTNRTHLDDYRAAITDRTRLLLRVHPSNFRIQGFTARPEISELAGLARERGIPLYEDLGSGCASDLHAFGIAEPLVSESLHAGADLVSFSGDKLLGGPQAGLLVGKQDLVARMRRNPLFRALRVDKMVYHALESTLRNVLLERWDQIPALAMIRQSPQEIYLRAEALLSRWPSIEAQVLPGTSIIGGGSTPEQSLDTWLIAMTENAVRLDAQLRAGDPPVIGRIEDDRLMLDLRTVLPEEEELLAQRLSEPRA
jgi:L-seryl-tRNA(Ser) seleniumtransferase